MQNISVHDCGRHTTHHRMVLIMLCPMCQTITSAQMLPTGDYKQTKCADKYHWNDETAYL